MNPPFMMVKDHPNRTWRRNKTRMRDIPNPSRILQVPKILKIPKGRRRRECSAHIEINWIMNNPHAWRIRSILWHKYFRRITLETSFLKERDHALNKGNHHSLVAINSSSDSWIIDYGASHHMAAKEEVFTSLSPCSRPPILMGYDNLVAVVEEGRV